ncbi:histidine kinase [Fluviicola sp.]|uniref:sensor histidine kinase n=1 Tax=Fluviicola sp. TaxID=1917219 RepID=UPI002607D2EB|nr:histidine kinase [Fluviicola sp.]
MNERVGYAVTESESGVMYFANSKAVIYRVEKDQAFRVKGSERYRSEILRTGSPILNLFADHRNMLHFSTFRKSYCIPGSQVSAAEKNRIRKQKTSKKKTKPLFIARLKDPACGEIYLSMKNRFGTLVKEIHMDSIFMSRTIAYEFHGKHYWAVLNRINLLRKDGSELVHCFNEQVVNFRVAADGHVWVTLIRNGLWELDQDLNPLEHYLENTTVSDVLLDDQSGMWVSTIGKGLYYCKNTNNHSFRNLPELSDRITLLKVIDGKLFIGVSNGKLFVREGQKIRRIDLKTNVSDINDVTEFKGRYYVGTKGFVFVLNKQFESVELIKKTSAYAFHKAQDGSLIVIAASNIFQRKNNGSPFKLLRMNNWNRGVVERNRGEFFIIKREGLYRMGSTFSSPAYLKKLRGKNISSIKTDSARNIWICTKGDGLYRLTTGNKLVDYANLPSEVINDISFFNDRIVLLSTNKGAFVNTLDQFENRASWKQLLDEEVLRMTLDGDELMIGTMTGLTSLAVDKLFRSSNYRFYLTSVKNGTETILPDQLSGLNYRQNDLYVDFDFLAFGSPSKQLFYKLEGPSGSEGLIEGTQIHLQNLSPGQYTLSTIPLIDRIYGKDQELVTRFYIKPAFWQTTFFFVFILIFGFALTILGSWWIMRRKRKKEEEQTRIEKLLTEYQLTALKAQVDPHFMSNSLVAIQELIIRKETSRANQYIAKFSMLIRHLLNYSDQPVISLRNELKIMDLYVDLEQLRFNNRFIFVKVIDENIQTDQLYIPALITQSLIENAIWHGLLPLTDERIPTLTLSIQVQDETLCISIIDNGVGRVVEPNKASCVLRESKGMLLILKRLENLNKLYAPAKGTFEFIDRFDEAGKPAGSTVRLSFSLDMINKLYDAKN